ncbi:putative S phase cyclin A-associated protein in the endoplasmic reticulum [Hypsibius exemplaris]|uniref:S phase cyclin A-associated protein in the endoplasmic reticulum n=1 Tax=Hypsibius exemplaris TaxID=2072580 RepID=A0A9X6N9I0_HYPEX|nr:putative S phase cyclin A-associated protein in the endoplasmic reticulum [Hypsibius exemplaris]
MNISSGNDPGDRKEQDGNHNDPQLKMVVAGLEQSSSSKSRRRKKAKQASKARRDAAGDIDTTGSVSELLSGGRAPASFSQPLQSSFSQKKTKSKNKNKSVAHSLIDPSTDRLMSPTKRCQHEEKIAKALENRELILQEKTEKVRQQAKNKKVEDARIQKAAALLQVRESHNDRLRKAEEKRQKQITTIKIKARDEATKVDEIHFINSLKSQNRIMDVLEKDQKVVSRQQILEEERTKRNEENARRDAAVEDRRRLQEQERVTKITEMEEKKRLKVKKAEQTVNSRLQLVRVKARDREHKLTAIEAAQQANLDSLKERIQRKIEISTRLHEERMELKRLRAQYLRSPRPGSADSAGHLPELIYSERCRSYTGDSSPRRDGDVKDKIRIQIEMDDIFNRYQRKGNKLRQRLLKNSLPVEVVSRGSYMECGDVSHALDLLSGLRFVTTFAKWTHQIASSLEPCLERLIRHIGFVMRSKEKNLTEELRTGVMQTVEFCMAAITSSLGSEHPSPVPEKPVCAMYNLLISLLACDTFNSLLATNIFIGVLEQAKYFSDALIFGRQGNRLVPEAVFSSCFQAVDRILCHLHHVCSTQEADTTDENSDRQTDLIKYLMTCGLVQMLGRYHVLPLHHEDDRLRYLRRSFQFTTWISRLMSARKQSAEVSVEGSAINRALDSELVIFRDVLKSAPVQSSVTLLYDLLRLGRSEPRSGESGTPELAQESYRLASDIIRMLNYIGGADLVPLQTVFRDLALSIQFRHICSFLIRFCLAFHEQRAHLLHEVVLFIGQFAFLSTDHQDILHAGHHPTLLHQLAQFPVEYFSCGTLQDVLLPTLIICCFQNRKNCLIMSEELDLNHLTLYIKDRELNSWPHMTLGRHFALSRKATPFYINLFREHSGEAFCRYSFFARFPRALWSTAAQFFYVCCPPEDMLTAESESVSAKNDHLDIFFRKMCLMLSDGGGVLPPYTV